MPSYSSGDKTSSHSVGPSSTLASARFSDSTLSVLDNLTNGFRMGVSPLLELSNLPPCSVVVPSDQSRRVSQLLIALFDREVECAAMQVDRPLLVVTELKTRGYPVSECLKEPAVAESFLRFKDRVASELNDLESDEDLRNSMTTQRIKNSLTLLGHL